MNGCSPSSESTISGPYPTQFKYRARVYGRLIISWCQQGEGAPFMDRATCYDSEGNTYNARVFLLKPWQRNRFWDRRAGSALVIGWRMGPRKT